MSVWIHTWCQRRIYSFPTDSATTGESELRARPALFKKTFQITLLMGILALGKPAL